MKIATWNVNSLKIRLPHILRWLESQPVDILALQETKMQDINFPIKEIENAGYQVNFSGQKSYNGMAILSRLPGSDPVLEFPDYQDPARRVLGLTINGIRIINLYVPNGSTVDSEKYQYKLNWLTKLNEYVQQQLALYPKLILLGDFNIAPTDEDVHDPQAWQGQVLVSPLERLSLQKLLQQGFSDVFRSFTQEPDSFSWWDYRAGAFRRNNGLRIDLILASEQMSHLCQSCIIDKEPRSWEQPSDHTPVIATFND